LKIGYEVNVFQRNIKAMRA